MNLKESMDVVRATMQTFPVGTPLYLAHAAILDALRWRTTDEKPVEDGQLCLIELVTGVTCLARRAEAWGWVVPGGRRIHSSEVARWLPIHNEQGERL